MKNYFTFVILILSMLLPLAIRATDLDEINTEAYLSMMDADKLMEDKKPAEALGYYQTSLQAYQNLKKQDPSFKTKLVDYRIDLLTQKVTDLKQQFPETQIAAVLPPKETDTPAEEKDYKALYFQTREKMVQDSARLLDLEKRNVQMTVVLRERQQETRRLQNQANDLQKQLKDAQTADSKASAVLQKEVKDLARFNNLLQDRADKLEITNGQLEKQRDDLLKDGRTLTDKLTALQEKHQALEAELADSKRNATLNEQRLILARNQLQDDLKVREQDLNQSQTTLTDLQAQLQEVPQLKQSITDLKSQNDGQLQKMTELQTALDATLANITEKQKALDQADTAAADIRTKMEKMEQENTDLLGKRSEFRDQIKTAAKENNDQQKEIDRLRKATETAANENAELQKTLANKTTDLTVLAKEVSNLRGNLSQETVNLKQGKTHENELSSQLKESEAERSRLALNLQQESDQRKRLEKNAEQQLDSITDRMNEIISLRQKIFKLETELKKAKASE